MTWNFRAMCTETILQSDNMPIQAFIRQQRWNGYRREISCCLLSLEKSLLGEFFKKESRKVLVCFFTISASNSFSWILFLLVLPTTFCQNFSSHIFWYLLSKLSPRIYKSKIFLEFNINDLNKNQPLWVQNMET